MTLFALVAAKDAAASIAATVTALRALEGVDEVWVVDDGSEDDTSAVAAAAGAHVLRLDANRGKGDALAAGVLATPHADRYLLADADLGATAAELAPLLTATEGLVVGRLPAAGRRGGLGLVSRLARAGIRRGCGASVQAPLSGQRVVDGAALRALVLAPRFGVEVGMTIDLVRAGAGYREVPVEVEHHHRGRSLGGFAHRARQGVDVVGALLTRLTSVAQRIAAIVVAAIVVFYALTGLHYVTRAPAGEALPRTTKVLLFAYNGLSLGDLERSDLPALESVRRRGAVGALSVRTSDRRSLSRKRGSERPSLADAYASLGASARVRALDNDMPASRALARRDHADSLPGSLGDALHAAGLTAAVTGDDTALLALADRHGRVEFAQSNRGNTAEVRMVAADPRYAAVHAVDDALAKVLRFTPQDATVIVFAPTPPGREWELTPIVIAGKGIRHGSVASTTTRRPAIAGLVDIAPTVLGSLGVEVPKSMTGAPLRFTDAAPDIAAIQRLEVDGAVRSRFFIGASVGYTVIGLVFYLAFMAALRWRATLGVRRALRVGACVAAAFPLALLVTGAMQHWLHAGGESPAALVAVTVVIGAMASRLRGLAPVYALAAIALTVIAIDVAVTGPLQAASILGYSIQTTGRYYGLPNASFSIYAASLLLVAAAVARWSPTRVSATGAAAVLAVGTAFLAAPWLGDDVGGFLTLLPVSAAAVWVLFGRGLTLRAAALGAVAVALIFGAIALLEARTGTSHLGRATMSTLTRRTNANFGLLVAQWWGFGSLALSGVGLAFLVPARRFPDYLPPRSGLRVCAVALLVTSIVGFLVNDSGPVVNVLCLVVLAPALALIALMGRRTPVVAGSGR